MSGSDQDAPGTDAPASGTATRLRDGGEVLFRQIHPNLYLDGKIASTAFMPTADDKGELSVDRSSLTTPAVSFDLYVANGRESVAVYGVSVGQFEAHGHQWAPSSLPGHIKGRATGADWEGDYGDNVVPIKRKRAPRGLMWLSSNPARSAESDNAN